MNTKITYQKENDLYKPIKETLENVLNSKYSEFLLEITAYGHISNKIKEKISGNREIIFHFLKEASPDITGYVKNEDPMAFFFEGSDYFFIVIEVKTEKIKLDHIYQIKKYAELFDAKLALLITLEEIPEELKRLSKVNKQLLSNKEYQIVISQYDLVGVEFKEWFPKNPFK